MLFGSFEHLIKTKQFQVKSQKTQVNKRRNKIKGMCLVKLGGKCSHF